MSDAILHIISTYNYLRHNIGEYDIVNLETRSAKAEKAMTPHIDDLG